MEADTGQRCPGCGQWTEQNRWVCKCGHLLRLDVLKHVKPADRLEVHFDASDLDPGADSDSGGPTAELTTVDAEATQLDQRHVDPQRGRVTEHEQATFRFDPVEALGELFMGRVRAHRVRGVDPTQKDLAPLDLYVLNLLDGQRSVADITGRTGLKKVELSVILLNLIRAGVLSTAAGITVETQAGTTEWGGVEEGGWADRTNEYARGEISKYQQSISQGDVTAATLHLKRSLAIDPRPETADTLQRHLATVMREVEAFYTTARYHHTANEPIRALAVLHRATQQFPGEAGFYNLMGLVTLEHDRKSAKAARAYLLKAVDLDPNNPTYLANLKRLEAARRSSARPSR